MLTLDPRNTDKWYVRFPMEPHAKYDLMTEASDVPVRQYDDLGDAAEVALVHNLHRDHTVYVHDGIYRCAKDGATWSLTKVWGIPK